MFVLDLKKIIIFTQSLNSNYIHFGCYIHSHFIIQITGDHPICTLYKIKKYINLILHYICPSQDNKKKPIQRKFCLFYSLVSTIFHDLAILCFKAGGSIKLHFCSMFYFDILMLPSVGMYFNYDFMGLIASITLDISKDVTCINKWLLLTLACL